MIKLNIKLAFRNLIKRKLYTIANVLGLAIGLFSFISILLYYNYEHSFDKFHGKSHQIYRLWDTFSSNDRQAAMMPFAWTRTLSHEFSEIDAATSIQQITLAVRKDDEVLKEQNVIVADTSFFEVFDFPVLAGQNDGLLYNPSSIILELETALRYFETAEDALGKQMTIGFQGNFETLTVEAIVKCPSNSHIQFDIIVPYDPIIRNHSNAAAYESYSTHFVYTYAVISGPFDEKILQAKFKDFLFKHGGEALQSRYTTSFQPLHDVYLKSTQEFDFDPRGSYKNTQILLIVAWLVLIISAVNFVNLSTAQSLKRSAEIGVRKIFGSDRKALIFQFLTEAIMIAMFATIVAVLLVLFSLPGINYLAGIQLDILDVLSLRSVFFILAIGLCVGLFAGFYPAFVISSLNSLESLKSESSHRGKGSMARKGLIIFQFCMAVILMIGTGVIGGQLDFMQNRDLGIDSEQVIVVQDEGAISNDGAKMRLLKNELNAINAVKAVSSASTYPGVQSWSVGFIADGFEEAGSSMSCIFTDHDFIKTYNAEIVAGRDFDYNIHSDSNGFLINESAQELFGLYDSTWLVHPIGKNIRSGFLEMNGPVIGVFKDFHFESLHNEVKPLLLMVYPRFKAAVQLRIDTQNLEASLSSVEAVWKKLYPDIPFDYEFVDKVFEATYKSDQQMSNLFLVFSSIAILLAVVGLFGLSSYVAKDKLRDISIRKVLGASMQSLVFQLGTGILVLGAVGAIIAMPIAYLLVNSWLDGFPYRIDVPIRVFVYSFIIIVIISAITTSYHALKTAMTNPVTVLRQS